MTWVQCSLTHMVERGTHVMEGENWLIQAILSFPFSFFLFPSSFFVSFPFSLSLFSFSFLLLFPSLPSSLPSFLLASILCWIYFPAVSFCFFLFSGIAFSSMQPLPFLLWKSSSGFGTVCSISVRIFSMRQEELMYQLIWPCALEIHHCISGTFLRQVDDWRSYI